MNGLENHILIVDDEFLIAAALCLQVEDFGMRVCGMAATAEEAIALAQRHRPILVLMDVRLSGQRDGIDAASEIRTTVGSRVIFITGSKEPATIERIHPDHPSAILFKPVSDRQLRTSIEAALKT